MVDGLQVATNDKESFNAHYRTRPERCHAYPAGAAQRGARQHNGYYHGRPGRTARVAPAAAVPNGTTGLIVGAAGGALIGRAIDTRGERTTGTVIGAAAGALLGRHVERSRRVRCR